MYGMAYISAVVEANGKAVKELSNEEGFDMGKVMEELLHDKIVEVRQEGRIAAFAEMVRDGVISISEAAKRSGLTEAAFKKIAVL